MIDKDSVFSDNNQNKIFTVNGLGVISETPACLLRLNTQMVFPYSLASIHIDDQENIDAVSAALKSNRTVAIFNELPPPTEFAAMPFDVKIEHFMDGRTPRASHGVLARIVKEVRFPDNSRHLVVRGLRRIIFSALYRTSPDAPQMVSYRTMIEAQGDDLSAENLAYKKSLLLAFQEYLNYQPMIQDDAQMAVVNATTPARTGDALTDVLSLSHAEKLLVLTTEKISERLYILSVLLNREVEALRLGMQIHNDVQQSMGESQREFYLREQLRAVKAALGEFNSSSDIAALQARLEECDLPEQVLNTVQHEIERLEVIPQNAPEYHISFNYISWLLDIPWKTTTVDRLDCAKAEKILDADHYGLEDVKERILEFLAVMQLRADDDSGRAPILCLVGPPGVGKTSIGQSIAKAMDRKFIRVSLGGVRDEAEIRGHRRTYVGAMPGRIVQNLKRAGSANPVFMLDEIDKLAHDFRGDPASALLEVLDPEQNNSFNDNFVELPLDLSKVFFIATANVLEDIPGPLRDRMDVIKLSGYTAFEKMEIAKRYLVKRQLKENGLDASQVKFQSSALDELIDGYTREAGVRNLERAVASVCRKIAREILQGKYADGTVIKVDRAKVNQLLGARKFLKDNTALAPRPGCATGLAWTSVGGVTLPVETVAVSGGKGELKLTGSLGKVMQESATAAFTVVRAMGDKLGIADEFFTKHDFHIHVPDGATPKDGPSAGITITLALLSLLSGKPLVKALAMTGEITLQSSITAIGGVREKLVGAISAGMKKILLPEENRKDFEELPDYIKDKVEVRFVSTLDEALEFAFESSLFPTAKGGKK